MILSRLRTMPRLARALAADRSGLAMIEFAYMLPVMLMLCLTGAELCNYVTVRMRVSQLALHIADNAARIGTGSQLTAKTISETDINDLLTGAGLQADTLNLYTNGRVILSDLEPVASPNTNSKYKIGWQRCRGMKVHASTYGNAGDTNLSGMGPSGRQAFAPDDSATMYVEVYYEYQPLVGRGYIASNLLTMTETASMVVRDRRDLTQIYNTEGATSSSCSSYNAG